MPGAPTRSLQPVYYTTCTALHGAIIAKFHYTDPTGPARTQRSFAAKKVRAGPCGSGRVRVVEFSFNAAPPTRRPTRQISCANTSSAVARLLHSTSACFSITQQDAQGWLAPSTAQRRHCKALSWRRGVAVSGVRRMNEVNPRRARLVPGWVTVFRRVYHLGM